MKTKEQILKKIKAIKKYRYECLKRADDIGFRLSCQKVKLLEWVLDGELKLKKIYCENCEEQEVENKGDWCDDCNLPKRSFIR